jgi:hypothetical protein
MCLIMAIRWTAMSDNESPLVSLNYGSVEILSPIDRRWRHWITITVGLSLSPMNHHCHQWISILALSSLAFVGNSNLLLVTRHLNDANYDHWCQWQWGAPLDASSLQVRTNCLLWHFVAIGANGNNGENTNKFLKTLLPSCLRNRALCKITIQLVNGENKQCQYWKYLAITCDSMTQDVPSQFFNYRNVDFW